MAQDDRLDEVAATFEAFARAQRARMAQEEAAILERLREAVEAEVASEAKPRRRWPFGSRRRPGGGPRIDEGTVTDGEPDEGGA